MSYGTYVVTLTRGRVVSTCNDGACTCICMYIYMYVPFAAWQSPSGFYLKNVFWDRRWRTLYHRFHSAMSSIWTVVQFAFKDCREFVQNGVKRYSAVCSVCATRITGKSHGGTTSNFLKHLKKKHCHSYRSNLLYMFIFFIFGVQAGASLVSAPNPLSGSTSGACTSPVMEFYLHHVQPFLLL